MGWNVAFRHVVLHIFYRNKIIHYDSKLNCFISIFFFEIFITSMYSTETRESPIPLLKTISRISNWPFHASQKIRKKLHVHRKKEAITSHVKIQRLNHVSHKNTNSIHLSQNIQNPPFWCIKMPCVTHRDRLDSRTPWFTVNISVSLFRFHIMLKGYKQFIFSTEITLGFLWINFFFISVLQLISPVRSFFFRKELL